MSRLADLLSLLAPRIGHAPWPTRGQLPPAPAIRQLKLPAAADVLAATSPSRPIPPETLAAARALLKGARENESGTLEPEPVDVEVLLALDRTERWKLRQLLAVRPERARGTAESWARVDLAILAGRGLEAVGVVRPEARLWVRDSALVPGMVEAGGPLALAWLARYPELAGAWAVRAVFETGERTRERGAAVLSWLRAHDAIEAVDVALGRLPLESARTDLAFVLESPHVEGVPALLTARLPEFARDVPLVPLPLHDGTTLDAPAVATLIRVFAAGTVLGENAVIAATLDEALPEARGDLVLALLEAWLDTPKRPATHRWVLDVAARLGDARAGRALVRAWRRLRRDDDPLALPALDALTVVQSDLALFELGRVAESERPGALRTRAWQALRACAEARLTTTERLIETTLPTLELDARGERAASCAPGWRLVVRPHGVTFRDPDGVLVPDAPRGKPGPGLRGERDELSSDLRGVFDRIARRLERAMRDARPLDPATFARMRRHPVVLRLLEGLVLDDGEDRFRVAEDASAATVEDSARPWPSGPVRIAHPATMAEAERAQWAALFESYELIQPFPQLGRPVHPLPAKLRDAERYPARGAARLPAPRVYALVGRGFHLDWTGEALVKLLPDGTTVTIRLNPPFDPRQDPREQGDLEAVAHVGGPDGGRRTLAEMQAGPLSELIEVLG